MEETSHDTEKLEINDFEQGKKTNPGIVSHTPICTTKVHYPFFCFLANWNQIL